MMDKRILLNSLLFSLSLPLAAAGHSHWSYSGHKSPEYWGDLDTAYTACKTGLNQSPVDLSQPAAVTDKSSLQYRHVRTVYKLENNGHTLEAKPEGKPQFIMLNGKKFQFKQFHFHTPSEHTFKGKYFPMEAHFVHQNEKGELAVLGVVFKAGKTNPALTPLTAKLLKSGQETKLAQALDIGSLFPKNPRHFHLNGSLTTPPCSEGVNWIVFETPVEAGKAQIEAMEKIIGQKNNRPIQPLNARVVIEEEK
ncbi:carbonic anhydrase [Neisseria chenwenguii]|uniref:carbonic anhydrase n=1 Tax=Neisseria chenwenguii TaxID=1853278 RepID=A0A220S4X2_9NEIS|nr:carbonic anhydrase family protein [Neisseria chenwenguii]ASK28569.1 carbonic anhydrase [Neisseria chenwenguii]ROV57434.1 carbonic anhydrase family protein [Neisseria chenwenguii]